MPTCHVDTAVLMFIL